MGHLENPRAACYHRISYRHEHATDGGHLSQGDWCEFITVVWQIRLWNEVKSESHMSQEVVLGSLEEIVGQRVNQQLVCAGLVSGCCGILRKQRTKSPLCKRPFWESYGMHPYHHIFGGINGHRCGNAERSMAK
jgi:hypothetical protein